MPRILVFDSGVGGLSVLDCIAAALPQVELLYAADNAYFPFGTKEESALVARVEKVLTALARRFSPDLIVIACNTASTVALPAVRASVAMPVVGTVPAIKPAAEVSVTRTIGLLGTPGTVRRKYTQALIDEFAADCTVLRHGCAELVELAERKLCGEPVAASAIDDALAGLFEQPGGERVDTVVLACTHFPLLGPELAASRVPRPLRWIDSGTAIARRVAALMEDRATLAPSDRMPNHRALFSERSAAIERLRPALSARGLNDVEFVAGW
jgi:glutamate racemase